MKQVSLIIPCFNEERRLTATFPDTIESFYQQVHGGEVIFVNDGSTDNTVGKIKNLLAGVDSFRILNLVVHSGKGKAVQEGMLAAKGDMILFTDADFSVPVTTVSEALAAAKKADIVIASRRHPQSRLVISQSKMRTLLGRGFTWLTNKVLGLSVSDVTCGLKCFRRDVAHDLFTRQRLSDWSFDAEILFLAAKRKYRVAEIPVQWSNKVGTKVHVVRDILRSLSGLIRIRLNDMLGLYG